MYVVPLGPAGSGKSTVADMLVQSLNDRGIKATARAFAEPLKQFAQYVFGFDDNTLYGPSAAREKIDTRYKPGSRAWFEAYAKFRSNRLNFAEWCVQAVDPNASRDRINQAVRDLDLWFADLAEKYTDKLNARIVLQTLGTDWGRNKVSEKVWICCFYRPTDEGVVVATDGRFLNEAVEADLPLYVLCDRIKSTSTHESETEASGQAMIDYVAENGVIVPNNGTLVQLKGLLEAHIVPLCRPGNLEDHGSPSSDLDCNVGLGASHDSGDGD